MPMTIRRILTRLRKEEQGFTMIMTLITMLVASVLVAAAMSAASGDAFLVRNDLDQKKAYAAAQAGISDYSFHLNTDVNYWTYCVPSPAGAVNQVGSTTNRRSVPGSTEETYAIELLPANGNSSCDTNNPVSTMIESTGAAAGTFRIRSTGYSHGISRSVVATFRRSSFLDFIYYTVYETLSPSAYASSSDRTAAATACAKYWRNGRTPPNGTQNYCSQIVFTSGDVINGPLHTEDELAICGTPTFGRTSADSIEVVAPAPGHSNQGINGCADTPTFRGTYITSANSLQPPPTNAQLLNIAQSSYRWTGQTSITLSGTSMTVTNNGTTNTVAMPSNGVVYVSSSSCPTSYTPFNVTYPGSSGCGTVTVHGSYSKSLTIATDNDIVIDGNLTHSGTALLGLIAQNYVRIYHPCVSNTNQSGSMTNPSIDAAMLAVTGSFIVDNYNCGASLGNLTVTGAIAQIFRGPVGTSGSFGTGYIKNYTYDDRLKSQEPPYFLNPVQAAWHVQRETECARGTTICP